MKVEQAVSSADELNFESKAVHTIRMDESLVVFRKIYTSRAFLECLNEHLLHQTLAKLALTISSFRL